ncbi:MAG: hypothetical protein ABH882_07020 [Candidatus Omnitrophota bacterium]
MKKLIYLFVLAMLVSGCAAFANSRMTPKLSLGMTKQDVLKIGGQPYKAAATIDKKTGEPTEVLTFREYICCPADYLYVVTHFKEGKLVQFGDRSDWMTAADYEGERKIKITTDQNINVKTDK